MHEHSIPVSLYLCVCVCALESVWVSLYMYRHGCACYYGIRWMCARVGMYWRCLPDWMYRMYTTGPERVRMHRERALKSHLGVFTYTQIFRQRKKHAISIAARSFPYFGFHRQVFVSLSLSFYWFFVHICQSSCIFHKNNIYAHYIHVYIYDIQIMSDAKMLRSIRI